MADAQRVVDGIVDEQRHAVGEDEAERQAGRVGDGAVAAIHDLAGVRPVNLGDAGAMHLPAVHKGGGVRFRAAARRCQFLATRSGVSRSSTLKLRAAPRLRS